MPALFIGSANCKVLGIYFWIIGSGSNSFRPAALQVLVIFLSIIDVFLTYWKDIKNCSLSIRSAPKTLPTCTRDLKALTRGVKRSEDTNIQRLEDWIE